MLRLRKGEQANGGLSLNIFNVAGGCGPALAPLIRIRLVDISTESTEEKYCDITIIRIQ